MTKPGSLMTRLKGRITRPVAEAAGDRNAEAKAALEAATGTKPADETLEAAKQQVREQHGDTTMPSTNPTRPSPATRAEEAQDATVHAGPDGVDESQLARDDADVDENVAEHYEEMIDRGAEQKGEGRLP